MRQRGDGSQPGPRSMGSPLRLVIKAGVLEHVLGAELVVRLHTARCRSQTQCQNGGRPARRASGMPLRSAEPLRWTQVYGGAHPHKLHLGLLRLHADALLPVVPLLPAVEVDAALLRPHGPLAGDVPLRRLLLKAAQQHTSIRTRRRCQHLPLVVTEAGRGAHPYRT